MKTNGETYRKEREKKTFGRRLKYFIDKGKYSPNILENKSYDTSGVKISARNIYRYINDSHNPDVDIKKRLADLLEISYEELIDDLGTDDRESFNVIDKDIRVSFFQMDLFECYKLVKYYDTYIEILMHPWSFVCIFSCLNSTGKKKLKTFLSQIETSLDVISKNLNRVVKFQEILNTSENKLRKLYNDYLEKAEIEKKMQNSLWNELYQKISKRNLDDIERFCRQMKYITTMDKDDLEILIAYCFLTELNLSYPSEKQDMLLTISDQLIIEYPDPERFNNK